MYISVRDLLFPVIPECESHQSPYCGVLAKYYASEEHTAPFLKVKCSLNMEAVYFFPKHRYPHTKLHNMKFHCPEDSGSHTLALSYTGRGVVTGQSPIQGLLPNYMCLTVL